ncbi:MAG: hypothetical protein J5881_04920 [Clostridia bacterium]|nr:hypothetical protein [Clostridia bacterium]
MSIITFISNGKEQTGKTLSAVAIATLMAIQHNMKILLVSTANDSSTLNNCFFPKQRNKLVPQNRFMQNGGIDNMQNGINGLIKMVRSNKIEPETIRNYSKVVFKDSALEILLSGGNTQDEDVSSYFPEIIKMANQYYDWVIVDLDEDIDIPTRRIIINDSDLVVYNISQRLLSIDNFMIEKSHSKLLSSFKTIALVGKHDKFSKYTAKNITRYMGERNQVLTIPYNTLYFEAAEEATVPDFFINSRNVDKEDRNYLFIQEVKRAGEAIRYRLQELQMRM